MGALVAWGVLLPPMLLPADARFAADFGWLQSHFLFSFAHHFEPDNVHLGALRVFNDDQLAPHSGYPEHPHAEVEIVHIVLSGTLAHTDGQGVRTLVRAGGVLRLTAGTGCRHTEANPSADAPLHLYQLWFRPRERGLQPAIEHRATDFLNRPAGWTVLLSSAPTGNAVFLNADATVWWANLEVGRPLPFAATETRQYLLYVAAGTVRLNGQVLEINAQARLTGEKFLTLEAVGEEAAVVLVELGAEGA